MDKYFDAIRKGGVSNSLLESFGFSDKIEKSHIEGIFEKDAPSRGFTIDKKGSDIKERLRKMLDDEHSVCTMLQVKWTSMLDGASEQPTEPAIKVFYYLVDGWEDKLGDLPALYPCVMDSQVEESVCKFKSDYNEVVYRYIGSKREIALLETMIANFDDNKSYKLTVKEASMLGW